MLLNRIGSGFCPLGPHHHNSRITCRWEPAASPVSPLAFHGLHSEKKNDKRRSVCTADELHYVSVSDSDWNLALWRYLPSPKAPPRNHPLLLLSGVATNAIGYDLSPESSFARYMSAQGFDTWTLEVRGAGLSTYGSYSEKNEQYLNMESGVSSAGARQVNNLAASFESDMKTKGSESEIVTKDQELQLTAKLIDIFSRLSNKVSDFLSGDLLGERRNLAVTNQIRDLNRRLQTMIEEGHPFFPAQVLELQERFKATLGEYQKQLEVVSQSDWDFDHYLEEDVPAAMEYIRTHCQPKDGKLLAIGHSMGGILLYAMLSRCGFNGKDSGLASVVTLASSLDYTPSRSSLKTLLPLAEPAQALNISVIPVVPLLATAYPLANYPPYVLSWLNPQISAQDMMDRKLFEKLVLNNFCNVPSKLLLQLTTAFYKGGLRDRSGSFFYKDHLHKSNVPVLAVAGDQDLICPPEAVYETAKLIPEELITYKVFGEPDGPHYAHYDLVGGRLAAYRLYPCITEFLVHHDVDWSV